MSLQQTWQKTLPHLKLSANQIEVARRFKLVAVGGDTMRFTTDEHASQSSADKLAWALCNHLQRPVLVVVVMKPHGTQYRSYKTLEGLES